MPTNVIDSQPRMSPRVQEPNEQPDVYLVFGVRVAALFTAIGVLIGISLKFGDACVF